jgi:hypothetical protein
LRHSNDLRENWNWANLKFWRELSMPLSFPTEGLDKWLILEGNTAYINTFVVSIKSSLTQGLFEKLAHFSCRPPFLKVIFYGHKDQKTKHHHANP